MKTLVLSQRIIIALFIFTGVQIVNQASAQKKYDIIIYGGTSAGFAAAIQGAKMGKVVALIEPGKHIGGNLVEGLGSTDIDNHKEFQNSLALGGLALEFYRRIALAYGRQTAFDEMLKSHTKDTKLWKTESSVAEKVINKWLAEYQIDIVLNGTLKEGKSAVIKQGSTIGQIALKDGRIFTAKMFIDATYEGDLLAAAGVSTATGREANSQYGETMNGIRASTTHAQFTVKVDPYIVPGNPSSGLIPTIQPDELGTPGAGDKNIQAYCFRVCLTTTEGNNVPFTKPSGYDRNQYEIYTRYLKAGGKLYIPTANLPNNKTDLGAWHDLSHNLYGMNKAYPEGSRAEREKVLAQHVMFTKGLFYFLATDTAIARLAPELQKQWAKWGYAKDEFTDNENFPRNFYVRDARRMVSDYVITEKIGRRQNAEAVTEPVAVAFWPFDVHSVRRIVRNGYAYNEGFVFSGDYWKPFGISYRALVPKEIQCANLLTATTPSASHIGFGALRLEHNFMNLGQVCAAAASIAIDGGITVQRVDYNKLKKVLLTEKLIIDAATVGMPADK